MFVLICEDSQADAGTRGQGRRHKKISGNSWFELGLAPPPFSDCWQTSACSVGRLKVLLGFRVSFASQASCRALARMRKQENEMTQLKYKLATGFPAISLTSGEDVHLQFARQMQPGDWIEWPAFERDAKRMLNYLLDVGIVHSSISEIRARSDLL